MAAAASFIAVACSNTGGSAAPSAGASGATGGTAVRLQLQWAPQAQFAGYFAADQQGYYEAEGLDRDAGPRRSRRHPAGRGLGRERPRVHDRWVPKVLEAREGTPASDLVNIAQVFQRSGTLSVSWKDSNITKPADFKGKKVGVWDFGNEFEVTAAAKKAGLDRRHRLHQGHPAVRHDAAALEEIDVAEAMIYNEYAQVLEAKNPETGELYKPDDLNVINYNDEGTAMLQDALYARAAWLSQAGNEDVAVKFLKASFKGWIYCRTTRPSASSTSWTRAPRWARATRPG